MIDFVDYVEIEFKNGKQLVEQLKNWRNKNDYSIKERYN